MGNDMLDLDKTLFSRILQAIKIYVLQDGINSHDALLSLAEVVVEDSTCFESNKPSELVVGLKTVFIFFCITDAHAFDAKSAGTNHGESTIEATSRPLVCHDVESEIANPSGDSCPSRYSSRAASECTAQFDTAQSATLDALSTAVQSRL
jgi:hypothetical protein